MISAKCVLFDLDGTLVDPRLGITRSIQYAMERMGRPVPPAESLVGCIGPPLHLSLQKLLSTADEATVGQAVGFFADRFETVGKYEAVVYGDVVVALEAIKRLGHKTYLATSKPQAVGMDILKHFGLASYFDAAYGSLGAKAALLSQLLAAESISADTALMVGDREHDIFAAQKNSIRSVGVTYGYGSVEELRAAKPDYLFDSLVDFASSLARVE